MTVPRATVLAVDDDPVNLSVISDYLQQVGFRVLVARDGESALARAQFGRPDLILLDMLMPRMDGLETCRRLKADAELRDIPVIFMTALAETEHKVQGFAAGGVDYITKPFQYEEVQARINAHLALHVLRRQLADRNAQLQTEIAERTRVAAELREARDGLELRVAERTRALAQANRRLSMLSACNQALVHAEDEPGLLRDICRIVVQHGQYPLVWVGVTADDQEKSIRPAAHYGALADELANVRLSWADDACGQGPEALTLRTGTMQRVDDPGQLRGGGPWYDLLADAGVHAILTLPLRYADQQLGMVSVNAASGAVLSAAECATLQELAGDLAYGIVVLRDRAQRRLAEQQVRQMNDELVRANAELRTLDEMKKNIMANVSHELRTPLVAVRGYTELLLDDAAVSADLRRKYLSVMLRNIDRLTSLFDNLLVFARAPQETPPPPVRCRVAVAELLQEAVETVMPRARQQELQLALAPVAAALAVAADPGQLRQVVFNLLDNALKFTPPDGTMTLAAAGDAGVVRMTVADTGIGISADQLPNIYDRFYQADGSLTRRYSGIGLGLAIAREIVLAHGGEITVASTPNAGTTFTLRLPAWVAP